MNTSIALLLTVTTAAIVVACGTVGNLATPTPRPADVPEPTPTPSLTDNAKLAISTLFDEQSDAIVRGDWESVFESCSPSYRTRRDVARLEEDAERYLKRLDTSPDQLDVRNAVSTKGRDDRYDLNFDLYIEGEFAETVRVGGAYIQIHGEWYDDGVWCR